MQPLEPFEEAGVASPFENGVRFVEGRDATTEVSSALSVRVAEPTALGRGKLRDLIDTAIEQALGARGAPAAGVRGHAELDGALSDQLYRARQVGSDGIAIYVPALDRATTLAGALDAEDSAVLRWWIDAARGRPVALLIDETNRALGAYGPPTRLDLLVCEEKEAAPPAPETPVEPPPPPVEPAPEPNDTEWRLWANELEAARGPKPLGAVERLFVSRYVPLAEAVRRGCTDASAKAVLESWAESFAKSYTEAFAALRVTGKRPTMVLDAPQAAARMARLHGARSTQLLLVDGMRFNLGLRVHERVRIGLGVHATCAERLLLWAALPSNTATQLDLLAHGPDGLSARVPPSEREEPPLGPRGIHVPRRVKIGGRDIVKLDIVQARLAEEGPCVAKRLDALADEVAAAVVGHVRALAPRTLVLLFGDHGFRMDDDGQKSGPGRSGGATPDEVLVPAFGWLVGDVH